jgi:phosphoenolpyruvate carboxylase
MRNCRAYDERLVQPQLAAIGCAPARPIVAVVPVVLGLTGQSVLLAHSPETLEFIRLRNTYLDPAPPAGRVAGARSREAALDSPLEQAC